MLSALFLLHSKIIPLLAQANADLFQPGQSGTAQLLSPAKPDADRYRKHPLEAAHRVGKNMSVPQLDVKARGLALCQPWDADTGSCDSAFWPKDLLTTPSTKQSASVATKLSGKVLLK